MSTKDQDLTSVLIVQSKCFNYCKIILLLCIVSLKIKIAFNLKVPFQNQHFLIFTGVEYRVFVFSSVLFPNGENVNTPLQPPLALMVQRIWLDTQRMWAWSEAAAEFWWGRLGLDLSFRRLPSGRRADRWSPSSL